MRIALVDTNPKPEVYPVALLKLGAWRKTKGDVCELFANRLPPAKKFDAIWLTTTFTYDLSHALGMAIEAKKRARQVQVGGISATLIPEPFSTRGIHVHRGLVKEAEAATPDYSLLPAPPNYSITHTSRGCVRKCDFCMVTKLEPKFERRPNWDRDLAPGAERIKFYDNNWLAKPLSQLKHDCNLIRTLREEKRINWIDFNQGLDARLFSEKRGSLLKGLPFPWLRFAFDGMHEDGFFQDACKKAFDLGFNEIRTYVLYNFRDTPGDLYYRLRECAKLSMLGSARVKAFPMRYQPILKADSGRAFIGKHWSKQMRSAFVRIVSAHSGGTGLVCPIGTNAIGFSAMDEFEFWFGANQKEFIRLLNYPRLAVLLKRKTVELRMKRAPDVIRRREERDAKRKGKTK